MDIRKYQFNIFCLLLFPLSATGQEWNKQDSLRLQQMLESGQEIKINRKFIEKVEQNMYSRKPFVDFDPTLPTLKSSMIFSKPSIRTYQTFLKPGSTFLPTYSWLRINKNLVLHSKSNFAENSSCFHIMLLQCFKFSPSFVSLVCLYLVFVRSGFICIRIFISLCHAGFENVSLHCSVFS